ncbi:myb-like protein X isoform X2 [Diaphorina citri]|uniref:Myb-like protein X isoform X1 n=1 Tax=Diaphorina citri TaxID=121845 RepID=A0A3Q0ITZ7_DIACI|nr:myb-like protein X isoform X1 [Diaphorina citri]XP_026677836.1 myb-like protein X isoform X2 [Diaphorina citri]
MKYTDIGTLLWLSTLGILLSTIRADEWSSHKQKRDTVETSEKKGDFQTENKENDTLHLDNSNVSVRSVSIANPANEKEHKNEEDNLQLEDKTKAEDAKEGEEKQIVEDRKEEDTQEETTRIEKEENEKRTEKKDVEENKEKIKIWNKINTPKVKSPTQSENKHTEFNSGLLEDSSFTTVTENTGPLQEAFTAIDDYSDDSVTGTFPTTLKLDEDFTTQETTTILLESKAPETIIIERFEDSNYISINDKNFLHYPNLRKIPPEKDTPNNYTTPTISTVKHSSKTREPSTWLTFKTTPKPTTVTTTTTRKPTTTKEPNGQGSFNLDKLSKSKNKNKIITKKPPVLTKHKYKYQNVSDEETSPQDATIQKLLKFIIECKAKGNKTQDANCVASKTSNNSISQLLYENEIYKLTGDKNYNNTLEDTIAKMKIY